MNLFRFDLNTYHTTSGIANIVGSVQEGFYNMPKLYGSEVRPVGPITDFKSGMREGGKVCNETLPSVI